MKFKPFSQWSTGWKVVTVLAGPILLMGQIFLGDVASGALNYSSVVEEAKREGAFVTAAELRERYGAKDSENAAPILREAQVLYDRLPTDRRAKLSKAIDALLWTKLYSNPLRAPKREALEAAPADLRDGEAMLALLEKSLAKPRCDFAPDWEKGVNVTFRELTFMKQAVKLVAARSHVLALNGNIEGSVRGYRLAMHLSRLSGDTPTLIPSVVACANYAVTYRQISHTLAVLEPARAAKFATAMRAVLGEFSQPIDPQRAFHGEMYILRVTSEEPGIAPFIPGLSTSMKTRVLEWCIETNRLLKQTPGDPIATSGIALPGQAPLRGLSYTIVEILDDTFAKASVALTKVLANHDVLVSAFEVVEERQRLGRWPDALPVPRRDPFGARPLKYQRDGNQVRVWSIGPDFHDSKGVVSKLDESSDDLVVRL